MKKLLPIALAASLLLGRSALARQTRAHADADADGGRSPSLLVRRALERGLSIPGARLDTAVEDRGAVPAGDCRPTSAEVLRPIDGSGRIAVKVSGSSARGATCDAWTWVHVRVVAPVAVAARALAAGERLDGATAIEERELRPGHLPAVIGRASVAARALVPGQLIDAALVTEPTVRAGESVRVLVVLGTLVIEQSGRGAPCARGRSCATLASGRLVEGELVDGKLVVQSQ
jgi:hypothetical protein